MTNVETATSAFLRVEGLTKSFPGASRPSVAQVDLALAKGEMLALLGPSGCGKTTLLRAIAGLVLQDAGRVLIDGQDMAQVPLHQRDISMVFQSYALFPHLNVARNVAFGLEVRGVPAVERDARVEAMLALTRLDGMGDRRIQSLSGGQQQRVALARALVTSPRLLLLDEPLANLDVKLRESMRREIRALQKRLGVTTVFVTHDQSEALASADKVAVMADGVIQQIGTPRQIYDTPDTRFVAEFVGRANVLDVSALPSDGIDIAGIGAVAAPVGLVRQIGSGRHSLVLRPQHLTLDPAAPVDEASARLDGVIEDVVFGGDMVAYAVRAGELVLQVEQHAHVNPALSAGDPVRVGWAWRDAVLLKAGA